MICLPVLTYGQTYLVDQHFSAVSPTGWSSTSSVWAFNRNETATGNYRNVIPQLIKVTNILGQEVTEDFSGIKFFHYSDGTIIKRF
jgi:hypothetical protein